MQIFKSNQFFYGLSIPEPDMLEPLPQKLPNADAATIDFLQVRGGWADAETDRRRDAGGAFTFFPLQKCLDTNPDKRWSATELLNHNYFQGFSFRVPSEDGGTSPFQQRKRAPNVSLPFMHTVGISSSVKAERKKCIAH